MLKIFATWNDLSRQGGRSTGWRLPRGRDRWRWDVRSLQESAIGGRKAEQAATAMDRRTELACRR